jgi:two-component system response regulator
LYRECRRGHRSTQRHLDPRDSAQVTAKVYGQSEHGEAKAIELNEIVVARDGALDYLFGTGDYAGRDLSILPQVVLLDLNVPHIGGLDVLRRIREEPSTKLLAVVVLTSSKDDEDIIRSLALGANSFVRKPVEFDEFSTAVKTLGLFWLSRTNLRHPREGAESNSPHGDFQSLSQWPASRSIAVRRLAESIGFSSFWFGTRSRNSRARAVKAPPVTKTMCPACSGANVRSRS